jgi:hypothetical protein
LEVLVRLATIGLISAIFGLSSANASTLQFTAITDTGETASFLLDTTVPNTYSPSLYPDTPVRGVYLGAVQDLTFEGTHIPISDVATTPGQTGDGRPLTVMEVGPLFNRDSLSLFLLFLDPTLVSPLQSDPSAYESSFEPFQSVLFPSTPPPRTHVDPLIALTVTAVPEPSLAIPTAVIALSTIALRKFRAPFTGSSVKLQNRVNTTKQKK